MRSRIVVLLTVLTLMFGAALPVADHAAAASGCSARLISYWSNGSYANVQASVSCYSGGGISSSWLTRTCNGGWTRYDIYQSTYTAWITSLPDTNCNNYQFTIRAADGRTFNWYNLYM